MRFRNVLLGVGGLITLLALFISDPNGGSLTATMLVSMATGVLAVGAAHVARKGLFDYLDMKELYVKAKETSIGAAIAFAGMCLVLFGLLGLFGNRASAAEQVIRAPNPVVSVVPAAARVHLPTLVGANKQLWSDHPNQQT
jgi:hypothetical protein